MTTDEVYRHGFDEDVQYTPENTCPECGGTVYTNVRETACEDCGLVIHMEEIHHAA